MKCIYKCEEPSVTCSSRKTSPKLSKTLTASSGLVGNENTRDHRSQSTSSPVAPLAEAVCESEQGRRSTTKAQSRIMTPISIQEFIAKYSHVVLYFASTTWPPQVASCRPGRSAFCRVSSQQSCLAKAINATGW